MKCEFIKFFAAKTTLKLPNRSWIYCRFECLSIKKRIGSLPAVRFCNEQKTDSILNITFKSLIKWTKLTFFSTAWISCLKGRFSQLALAATEISENVLKDENPIRTIDKYVIAKQVNSEITWFTSLYLQIANGGNQLLEEIASCCLLKIVAVDPTITHRLAPGFYVTKFVPTIFHSYIGLMWAITVKNLLALLALVISQLMSEGSISENFEKSLNVNWKLDKRLSFTIEVPSKGYTNDWSNNSKIYPLRHCRKKLTLEFLVW